MFTIVVKEETSLRYHFAVNTTYGITIRINTLYYVGIRLQRRLKRYRGFRGSARRSLVYFKSVLIKIVLKVCVRKVLSELT